MSDLKKIAFFDFDGTITKADTMIELIRYHFGTFRFYSGMLAISLYLVGLKVGMVSRQKAKEKLLSHFFGNMEYQEFTEICQSFSRHKLPQLVKKEALNKIEELRLAEFEIVVVTASASDWVMYWCAERQISLIASELQVSESRLTGKLKGKNCNTAEKAVRIRNAYDLTQYAEIFCFGDSSGDREMLSMATQSFYRKFN